MVEFYFSRSHAFRYGRKNTNPTFLVRIEPKTSALARCAGYLLTTRTTSLHTYIYSPGGSVGIFFFSHLTYSRWTLSLPSSLWSLRIFPSLPGITIFYRDASSAILQLVNQWLNFTSRVPTLSVTEERTQILLFW